MSPCLKVEDLAHHWPTLHTAHCPLSLIFSKSHFPIKEWLLLATLMPQDTYRTLAMDSDYAKEVHACGGFAMQVGGDVLVEVMQRVVPGLGAAAAKSMAGGAMAAAAGQLQGGSQVWFDSYMQG